MCVSARVQADLHQLVVFGKISSVQLVGYEVIVDKALPRHWQTEDIEAVFVAKVLHLTPSQFGRRAAIRTVECSRLKIALAPIH
jgi:hypothetical protein